MSDLCIDASAAVKLALRHERLRSHARQIFIDAAMSDGAVIAPQLFIYEVDSIIRANEQSGSMSAKDVEQAYADLDGLEIIIIDSPHVRRRAREIARRFGQQRVYDSTYAALADIRGCEFWTADHAFYRAVTHELPYVKYLADYSMP